MMGDFTIEQKSGMAYETPGAANLIQG